MLQNHLEGLLNRCIAGSHSQSIWFCRTEVDPRISLCNKPPGVADASSSESNLKPTGYCILLEKAMAPHSSTLAWKIPWTEEPGSLQSMSLLRVRHDWATSLSLFTFMHWRRKWQRTPVFLPGESQGRGSLVSCHLWGRTELDTTEVT